MVSVERRLPIAAALVLDVVAVMLFAAIGRRTHGESTAIVGVLATGWPFLVGALAGWTGGSAWRRPASLRTGAIIAATAWAGGMALRAVTGQGTAVPFLIVAAVSLVVLLIGWRLVAGLTGRRRPVPGS
jgi:peptidoglycan/LPS O-acetylase OafA/YrhL